MSDLRGLTLGSTGEMGMPRASDPAVPPALTRSLALSVCMHACCAACVVVMPRLRVTFLTSSIYIITTTSNPLQSTR